MSSIPSAEPLATLTNDGLMSKELVQELTATTATADAAATASSVAAAIAALGVAKAATVAATDTQASGAGYGDLATVGPKVVVSVPAGGKSYAVLVTTGTVKSFSGFTAFLSFDVTGVTTIVAGTSAEAKTSPAGPDFADTITCIGVVTLNAGENTITAKYKNNGGPGPWSFFNRGLIVVPLG